MTVFGPAVAEETLSPPDIRGLVRDLGHHQWTRRQAAEEKLLSAGLRALELLKMATASSNPELASRARYLVSVADPWLGDFTIVKVRLGRSTAENGPDTHQIVQTAHWLGPASEHVAVRGRSLPGIRATDYDLSWHPLAPERLEVQVHESAGQPYSMLARPLTSAPAVSVLKFSEECRYEHYGILLKRKRQRFLTLLFQRQLRRSEYEEESGDDDPARLRAGLLNPLFQLAHAGGSHERSTALEILALLRVERARPLFLEALASPSTFAAGALGLGYLRDPDAVPHLAKILEDTVRSRKQRARPGRDSLVSPAIRAAVLLAELGDPRGISSLLDAMEESDASHAHTVMASLCDHLPLITRSVEQRRRFLETVLRRNFLLQAPWSDPETEHILTQSLTLLDSSNQEDAAHASRALDVLRALATERQVGVLGPDLETLVHLWSRAARVARATTATPPHETALLEHVLENSSNTRLLSSAVSMLLRTYAGQPLAPETFDSLISGLRTCLKKEDRRLAVTARSAVLDTSRSITLGEGQLQPLVELLIEATSIATPGNTATRTLRQELKRWSGVGDQRTTVDVWKDWLGAEDTVAERERELLRTRAEASSSGEELVVYKFNVLVSASVTPGSTAEPVTVLDGRRLVVRSGQVATYHDRWENVRRLQVEFLGRQGNGPRRYRVRGLSPVIVEGRPILSSAPGGATGASWYETSPLYPGVRRLLRSSSRYYRDLILIRPAPEEPAPPAGLPSGEKGVTALWELFLKRYLLNVSEHAEPQELSYLRELLRHLRLPEAIPALRRILTLAPSVETARCLYELGDQSGEDYLLKELHQNEFTRRLTAASVLSQLGHPGGVEALIELASQNPARFSRSPYRYQSFASLTQYIDVEPSDENDPVRTKILDFVFAQLDIPTFQRAAFNIVRLVAGTDFGYIASRRIRGAAAKASVERAVESARRWWREHKNKN